MPACACWLTGARCQEKLERVLASPPQVPKRRVGQSIPAFMPSLIFFSMPLIKEARIKMNYQASTNKKVQHESQLSAKKDDKLFFNGKSTPAGPARAQPRWEDWRLQTEMSPSWDEQPGQRVRPLPRVGSGRSLPRGDWGAPAPPPACGSEERTVLLSCRQVAAPTGGGPTPCPLLAQFHCGHCSFPGAGGAERAQCPRGESPGNGMKSSELGLQGCRVSVLRGHRGGQAQKRRHHTAPEAPCAPDLSPGSETRLRGTGAESNTHSRAPLSFPAAGPGTQVSVCPQSPVSPGIQPLGLEAGAVTGVRSLLRPLGAAHSLTVQIARWL